METESDGQFLFLNIVYTGDQMVLWGALYAGSQVTPSSGK